MSSAPPERVLSATRDIVIVVAGPTASGKSALAIRLAEALDGVVINADSMQVYADLRVITARPGPEDEARVPHRLYGILSAAEKGSAAWWRDRALAEIRATLSAGKMPILCGGTGLYIRALTEGIAEIPAVPATVQAAAKARHAEIGGAAFREELRALDPVTAERLHPGDTQRLQRAWSVARATGRPFSAYQAEAAEPAGDLDFRIVLVDPPREAQIDAIDRRFEQMVAVGGLEEVRALASQGLDPDLPAMKALGVPHLIDYIQGKQSLEAAVENAKIATRQYAKRQRTWFRHQIVPEIRIERQFSESTFAENFPEIRKVVLTGS